MTVLTCSGLTTVGCSSYRPPSIRLVGVRLVEQTDEAAAFHFDLVLENPNDEPIELHEFQYKLLLDGTQVFQGRRAATTTLQPDTISQIALPAVVRYEVMGWSDRTLPAEVDYQLSGGLLYVTPGELAEILLDTGVRRPTIQFNRAGRLDLPSN